MNKFKTLKTVFHSAGFYLDLLNETQKIILMIIDKDNQEAINERAIYIYNKFFKED